MINILHNQTQSRSKDLMTLENILDLTISIHWEIRSDNTCCKKNHANLARHVLKYFTDWNISGKFQKSKELPNCPKSMQSYSTEFRSAKVYTKSSETSKSRLNQKVTEEISKTSNINLTDLERKTCPDRAAVVMTLTTYIFLGKCRKRLIISRGER